MFVLKIDVSSTYNVQLESCAVDILCYVIVYTGLLLKRTVIIKLT